MYKFSLRTAAKQFVLYFFLGSIFPALALVALDSGKSDLVTRSVTLMLYGLIIVGFSGVYVFTEHMGKYNTAKETIQNLTYGYISIVLGITWFCIGAYAC